MDASKLEKSTLELNENFENISFIVKPCLEHSFESRKYQFQISFIQQFTDHWSATSKSRTTKDVCIDESAREQREKAIE